MKNAWRRQAFCTVSALMAFHYFPGQVQTLQEGMEEFAKPSQRQQDDHERHEQSCPTAGDARGDAQSRRFADVSASDHSADCWSSHKNWLPWRHEPHLLSGTAHG